MERISSGGRELKVAILVDCSLGGYGGGMEWNEDGMKMELMGYRGHYIPLSETLIVLLAFVNWISHETMDESLVVPVFHPMVCA